jgi:hypothetical protein
VILSDYFNDDVLSFTKWKLGSLTGGATSTDEQVEVSQSDGKLQIQPRSSLSARSYYGVITRSPIDMTSAFARVEVLQVTNGSANTIFAIGWDSDNWYGFVFESGKLYMQSKINGRKNSVNIPYSFGQHRFWRLRHDTSSDQLVWETSADGQVWTIRRTITPESPLSNVRIYLGAGTYLPETVPGFAIFDNFRFVVQTGQ